MKAKTNLDQLSVILKQKLGVHGNKCETLIDFCLALSRAETVNLSKMVNQSTKVGKIDEKSIYKNYQRTVHDCKISQEDLAWCTLEMFNLSDCKLTLSLDRTNWKYGVNNINLLMLSVCAEDCAIPLFWQELDKRGNSNSAERKDLMTNFIKKFGAERIDYLVADREFIGNEWLEYLNTNQVKFAIRIKSNMQLKFKNKPIKAGKLFSLATKNTTISYLVDINGIRVLAQATRSIKDELVIVISNDLTVQNLLGVYTKRWAIECLFGNLKSRGFNFEDTHITIKERIGNLTKMLVLSFNICYLLGLVRAKLKPIKIKKHGYKQFSYFRYGHDLLIQKLNSAFKQAIKLICICFSNLDLERKCKKLISVM